MAKKSNKKATFGDIGKLVESSIGKTSIILEDAKNPNTVRYTNTGIYLLNALFSTDIFKGIPSNRIVALAGAEQTGKTFLCLNIAREAQKNDGMVIYIDTEFSIELDKLKQYGIDVDSNKFKLLRINVIEDIKIWFAKFLDKMKELKQNGAEFPKITIFLDSAGALASRKEVQDALDGKEKADMTRAKVMGSLFRIIMSDLGYLGIPLIVTNHTYMTNDLFPQEVMKGGKGLYYGASIIAFLSKAKLKTGAEGTMDLGQSGIVVSAKSKKNRLAKPKKIKFEIDFTKGCNPFKGLEAFCLPQYFDTVGIAKGKFDKDGKFIEGGNKWAIKHLNKTVWEKQLHTPDIFTKEVLNALQPIIQNYFEYKDYDEVEKLWNEVKDMEKEYEDELNTLGISINEISDDELFN
jgi:RecA/RadA recombinase